MTTNKSSEAKPTAVLWPDLSRFGVSLTVAYNPSLGRNFLRLAVLDREIITRESGLDPKAADFFRIMREVGFTYMPSETEFRRMTAYWDAERGGLSAEEADDLIGTEAKKVYFYSPSLAVRKDWLKTVLPNLRDSDFRQMPVAEIKHFDFRYLPDDKSGPLLGRQQAFVGGEAGVFYTLPPDRNLLGRLAQGQDSIHDVLRLGLGAKPGAKELDLGNPDVAEISRFHPIPSVERLFGGQALTPEGLALRTIAPSAVVVGYPRYEDAVAANGGDVEGVERIHLPYGLPVAFDYPLRRVVIVKDGRYLEMTGARTFGTDEAPDMETAQTHWAFLDHVFEIHRKFMALSEAGVLDEGRWGDNAVLDAAHEALREMGDRWKVAMEGKKLYRASAGMRLVDLSSYGGLRFGVMPGVFGKDFMAFLEGCQETTERVGQALAVRDAEAVARMGMLEALAKIQSLDEAVTIGKRQDAGEKIGGARKDYAKRWLVADELSSMTVREWTDVVSKDNVWPAPDYAAMKEQGVAPEVAYLIREFRSALPTNPYRGGYNIKRHSLKQRAQRDLTLQQCESFVKAVSLVRDALAEVKTRSDLEAAVVAIREQSDTASYSWRSENWFSDGAGYEFAVRVLPEIVTRFGGQRDGQRELDGYAMSRLFSLASKKTGDTWDWAGKKKRLKTAEDGSEEATAGKRERPEPEVPHLEHIVRDGKNYRDGRNVDEQMLMEVFGFRGVEYGNWLPQGERQTVLNHAFDAFMDLSEVLKLPPKAMGLGGELAIAFGARGRGGKRAACAHYEPARVVINLTRLSGAGFLAHEWGHALDYFLARSLNLSQARPTTDWGADAARASQPTLKAFLNIVEESRKRYRGKDEVLDEFLSAEGPGGKQSLAETLKLRMREWINRLERSLPEDKRGGVFQDFAHKELEKALVAVDGLGGRIVRLENPEVFTRNILTAMDLQVGREWREWVSKDVDAYPARMAKWIEERIRAAELIQRQYDPKAYPASSRFLEDGEYFDSFRSKPYWSTRVELFARAFEAWVQDKIESTPGHRSQYLVYGKGENATAEHSGYPRGEERIRIGEAMAAFFEGQRPELIRRLGLGDPEASRRNETEAIAPA